MVQWWCGRKGLGSARGLVPLADGELREPAEQGEDRDAEERGREDRGEQLRSLEAGRVVGDEGADARGAAAEEEGADDGTDDREPGGDPHAGEDRGQRGGQLQLREHR